MIEIKMPSAGQTTDEATIVSVHVKVGDTVKRGDVLVEAETDKAILPIECYAAGTVLAVMAKEGMTVTADTVLAVIGKAGEALQQPPDAAGDVRRGAVSARPSPPEQTAAESLAAPEGQDEYLPIVKGQPARPGGAKPASPAAAESSPAVYPAMPGAKMLAKEHGVDVQKVEPSNKKFVKRMDVERYLSSGTAEDAETKNGEYEIFPMTSMRQVISRRMQESVRQIPSWQCTVSIRMEACMQLREAYRRKRNVKLSYNDIMAKAIAVAARQYPLVNARFEQNEVRVYRQTNVGLAVALENALVVPVVKGIDKKGLEEISRDYQEKIEKARQNRLSPGEMGCGSITISNLGMYDVERFIAIVNPPESCILAVASIQVRPEWDGEKFVPVHMMTVTGSFDHRIIDGAYGARFLQEFKTVMEDPGLMLC